MTHPSALAAIPISWRPHDRITSVACGPNKLIAIACHAGYIWLMTADSGGRDNCMLGTLPPAHAVAFSSDGTSVASGHDLGTLAVWSLRAPSRGHLPSTEAAIPTVIGHGDAVRAVAFSPDGQQILAAGDDGTVGIWAPTYTSAGNLTSIQAVAAWSSYAERILALASSPDGQAVAIGGTDGIVRLHNTTTGTLQRSFAALASTVNAVAFDPHGMHLAASGPDGALRLWSLATNENHSLTGHEGTIEAVAFCPNGKYLASAGHDGTVRLWSVPSGSLLTGIRIEDTLSTLA